MATTYSQTKSASLWLLPAQAFSRGLILKAETSRLVHHWKKGSSWINSWRPRTRQGSWSASSHTPRTLVPTASTLATPNWKACLWIKRPPSQVSYRIRLIAWDMLELKPTVACPNIRQIWHLTWLTARSRSVNMDRCRKSWDQPRTQEPHRHPQVHQMQWIEM